MFELGVSQPRREVEGTVRIPNVIQQVGNARYIRYPRDGVLRNQNEIETGLVCERVPSEARAVSYLIVGMLFGMKIITISSTLHNGAIDIHLP